MPESTARTVISIGDARLCAYRGCERGRGWNEGAVAPELGSLSNSGTGTVFVEGSERRKKKQKKQNKRALGMGAKV